MVDLSAGEYIKATEEILWLFLLFRIVLGFICTGVRIRPYMNRCRCCHSCQVVVVGALNSVSYVFLAAVDCLASTVDQFRNSVRPIALGWVYQKT